MPYTLAKPGWLATAGPFPVTRHPLPAKCFYSGWTSRGPIGVMLHGTAGCTADIWPVLETRGISAHFNIARDGTIYQYVSLADRAAHAYDANHLYFAIEHTGQNAACKWYTAAQRASSVALSAALVEWTERKWGTTIPSIHIPGCPLKRGFKEHYDGAVPIHCDWNPNVHVDRPGTHWGWGDYLDDVADHLVPKTYWLVDGKRFNRFRRALRYFRKTLADSEPGELHSIRVRQD